MEAAGTTSRTHCPGCGYANDAEALTCSMCAHVLSRSAVATPPAVPTAPGCGAQARITRAAGSAPFLGSDSASFPAAAPRPRWGAARVLVLGAVLAPLFLLPILRYMGWFLASLVHETGHCLFAWLFGHPAFPAIRLDGHAAAVHREQHLILVVLVGAVLAWLLYLARNRRRLRILAGVGLVLYPLLALTEGRDILHLLGGHLGELAFAGIFFVRALSGGVTESLAERVTYAVCAWFLTGRNVVLAFSLMTSEAARAHYAGSGSYGLTNDYLRVARDHLHWSLEGVAGLMLLCSIATLPIALLVGSRFEPRQRNSVRV